MKVTVY